MKRAVMKCVCGRVSNPITLEIVSDTWLDNKGYVFFEYICPQCKKLNTIKIKLDKEQ